MSSVVLPISDHTKHHCRNKRSMITPEAWTPVIIKWYFYIFSRTTLNETFTAKYDGVLPRTPEVRPKSEIYTPQRDDEHPHPFHMRNPSPPRVSHSFAWTWLWTAPNQQWKHVLSWESLPPCPRYQKTWKWRKKLANWWRISSLFG